MRFKNKSRPISAKVENIQNNIETILDPAFDIENIILANETVIAVRSIMEENITLRDIKLAVLCYYDKSDENIFEIIANDVS
jgi:mannose/fructose/N-acetylgalactosamine-specific phosphotransferase system component IIB